MKMLTLLERRATPPVPAVETKAQKLELITAEIHATDGEMENIAAKIRRYGMLTPELSDELSAARTRWNALLEKRASLLE